MNRENTYKLATDRLYNAYFNDTLEKGSCSACAVGNILQTEHWGLLFHTNELRAGLISMHQQVSVTRKDTIIYCGREHTLAQVAHFDPLYATLGRIRKEIAEILISNLGYSQQEMMKVEYAFESAPKGETEDETMFNGLMAVLNVLNEIHEVEVGDEESLKRFKDHYQMKKVREHCELVEVVA